MTNQAYFHKLFSGNDYGRLRRAVSAAVAAAILAVTAGPALAQSKAAAWHFEPRQGAATGIAFAQRSGTPEQRYIVDVKSTGVALLDFDRDGLLDLFFTAGSTVDRHRNGEPGFGCRLFRNTGDLRFVDVTAAAGIPALGWASAVAAADWDGDGWDDLLVTCVGTDRLLRNDEGRFDGNAPALSGSGWSAGAAFADLDLDGDLDIYITGYLQFDFTNPPVHGAPGWSCTYRGVPIACGPRGFPPQADRVFRQDGGEFTDVSSSWGFASTPPQFGLGVLIADLHGDPRPEVFVANDASPNFLFTNSNTPDDRGPSWQDNGFLAGVAYNEDGEEQAGMGVDAADVDNDGDLDVFVTNFEEEKNNLYVNQGNGTFVDRTDHYGLGAAGRPYLSWGTAFRDFDNDGYLDLFVANGHVYPEADADAKSPGYAQRDHLFVGTPREAGFRFVERGSELGMTPKGVGRGAAFGDLDNDGDVDIVVCNLNAQPLLYVNHAPTSHRSLQLTLEQPGANRQAIGARVTVRCGDLQRTLEVRRNDSFQASSAARLHVGLGTTQVAGTVEVRWPGGDTEHFTTPAGGGAVTLVRGSGSREPMNAAATSAATTAPQPERSPSDADAGAGTRSVLIAVGAGVLMLLLVVLLRKKR
ncbi:MAG: CRTAC1 family protein [Planctomycetota bacterium]